MKVTSIGILTVLLAGGCASVPAEPTRNLPAALDPANPAAPEGVAPPLLSMEAAEPPHQHAASPHEHTARPLYVCPMHPEVTSDRPGQCPKCGMKLEQKKVAPDGGARP